MVTVQKRVKTVEMVRSRRIQRIQELEYKGLVMDWIERIRMRGSGGLEDIWHLDLKICGI